VAHQWAQMRMVRWTCGIKVFTSVMHKVYVHCMIAQLLL